MRRLFHFLETPCMWPRPSNVSTLFSMVSPLNTVDRPA
jgi:hypothetical protein